jgi:hypothetical protein
VHCGTEGATDAHNGAAGLRSVVRVSAPGRYKALLATDPQRRGCHRGGCRGRDTVRAAAGPHRTRSLVRVLAGGLEAKPFGHDRDFVLGRSDRCRACLVLGPACHGRVYLLLALLRLRRRPVSRLDARVHGRHGRLLADRRPLQHGGVLRADGSRGLRADRLQGRRARADPGRDQLRHLQQHRGSPCCTPTPARSTWRR